MIAWSPLSHIIALGLGAWLALIFRRATGPGELVGARTAVLGVLSAWLLASSTLAWHGQYLALNESWLLIVIGSAMTPVLVGVLALASRDVQTLLGRFLERVSYKSLTLVHAVRMAGIGTIYKWYAGLLPAHFILPVAVPDFLIGLSALWMSRRLARSGGIPNRRLYFAWNVLGAAVLLLAVPLIQLSQPGPLHLFTDGPSTDEVLSFPMSIVPTFVAPLFVLLHVAALVKLARDPRTHTQNGD